MWMDIANLVTYLLPLAAAWAGVLWIRPAVARARVHQEALSIRDCLEVGILSGDIEPENPRALDAMKFCEFVARRPDLIKMSRIQAVERALKKANVDLRKESRASFEAIRRQSQGLATPAGLQRIEKCEEGIDRLLADFLVRNTALWPALVPLRWLARHLPNLRRHIPEDQLPGVAAADLRAASRGRTSPPDYWTAPTTSRKDREFAHV
ncbi:Uncharacterised protein [Mycobacteroides abscessus subsp. abscessus]|nr:Uncharacterised protein [Mycobacteroides abscessus subsp. abscessus]SHU45211.1 Uncharacterised protein [Mycobacteroides abscessus subsp. abscessus]